MNSKIILLAFFSSLALSCTRSNYYEHQPLTSLPSQTHNGQVDVYFEGENTPTQDYLEYYDLRIVKKGDFNDQQMVSFLKAEARKKGLDGIIQLNKWDESEETVTFFDVLATVTDPDGFDYTSVVNYSIIEGKGIKYLHNIDLSKSVKSGKVYEVASQALVGEINFLANGLMAETVAENSASELFMDTYYKLSEDFLLREEKGWQTLHKSDGRIDVRRKYRMNDWVLARVRVKYQAQNPNRINTIRLTENPKKSSAVSKVTYGYDDQGRVTNRVVSGAQQMTETMHYQSDLLKESEVSYMGVTYKIVYDFYQQSDLDTLIKKAGEKNTDQ